jgi:hypothetical protein
MKRLLITSTSLAALALVPAATGLTAARSAGACSPLPGPRAIPAGQTVLFGHIKSLTRKGRSFELKFDPALLLTGRPAEQAALQDTGSSDVPNDFYVVDETHRAYTYVVPASAHVTVLPGGRPCVTVTSVATLAHIVRARTKAGFNIRVSSKYPSPVVAIDQQYQP